MFQLRCSVRRCHQALHRDRGGLTCGDGHHFDRAKEGYFSLLQPQDRKSLAPGDHDDAVSARRRWLDRGHASGLIECLRTITDHAIGASPIEPSIVDLGCGDGSFPPALFPDYPNQFCGIDLSKKAIKLAAKKWPPATWVWANADRELPIQDHSISLVMSLFGRRPTTEISRIVHPGGRCVVAIPAEDDLIELREQTQKVGLRRSRWEKVVEQFNGVGLKFQQHIQWRQQIDASPEEVSDALAMTYRAVRHAQRQRLKVSDSNRITFAADILVFEQGN